MIPFIPPKLAPWIEFIPNDVVLKPDAPEEMKPLFDDFKAKFDRATAEANALNIISK